MTPNKLLMSFKLCFESKYQHAFRLKNKQHTSGMHTQNNIEKILLGGVLSAEKIPKVYLRL